MSKTSSWIYDLQERCGFQEDEYGNPVINWDPAESIKQGLYRLTPKEEDRNNDDLPF